jgi:hypothetical protein
MWCSEAPFAILDVTMSQSDSEGALGTSDHELKTFPSLRNLERTVPSLERL